MLNNRRIQKKKNQTLKMKQKMDLTQRHRTNPRSAPRKLRRKKTQNSNEHFVKP